MALMATLRVKMFKWQLYKMTYTANRRMDLPKKRGHFDVLRHRSKKLFLLFFFYNITTHLTSGQCSRWHPSDNTSVRP